MGLSLVRGGSLGPPIAQFLARTVTKSWINFETASLFQDTAGATPATVDFDPIGRANASIGSVNATQGTAGSRPILQFARTVSCTKDSSFNVPDALGGTVGEGFTITGLCYDGTNLWAGNHGLADSGDSSYEPSLVKMSTAGSKLAEIDLLPLYPSCQSVQGVAFDTSDSTLWFASLDEGQIRHLTTAGVNIGNFALASANGLAYDSLRDRLWCVAGTTLTRRDKSGNVEFTKSIAAIGSSIDHLAYDAANDRLWITEGNNGVIGTAWAYDIGADAFAGYLKFADATAVEGIALVGSAFYVAHDGFFHSAQALIDKNQVQVYSATFAATSTRRAKFDGSADIISLGIKASTTAGTLMVKTIPMTLSGVLAGANDATPNRLNLALDASGRAGGGLGTQNFTTIHGSVDRRGALCVLALVWNASTVSLYHVSRDGTLTVEYSAARSGNPTVTTDIQLGALFNGSVTSAYTASDILQSVYGDVAATQAEVQSMARQMLSVA